jgi:hypothetical protein
MKGGGTVFFILNINGSNQTLHLFHYRLFCTGCPQFPVIAYFTLTGKLTVLKLGYRIFPFFFLDG